MCFWIYVSVFKILCGSRYRAIAPSEDDVGHIEQSPNMDAFKKMTTNRNVIANTLHGNINNQHNTWTRRPMFIIALFLITWTDGHTGKRIGEADIPGHGRRGPKGRNQRAIPKQTKKEHIWLRSHNVGSIRAKDRREDALDADIDLFAFQETSADIKTIHDAKT